MSQGQHVVDAAVHYPVVSLLSEVTPDENKKPNYNKYMQLSQTIYNAGIDNDIIDDDSILNAKVKGGQLIVGGNGYRALVFVLRLPGNGQPLWLPPAQSIWYLPSRWRDRSAWRVTLSLPRVRHRPARVRSAQYWPSTLSDRLKVDRVPLQTNGSRTLERCLHRGLLAEWFVYDF